MRLGDGLGMRLGDGLGMMLGDGLGMMLGDDGLGMRLVTSCAPQRRAS